MYFCSFGESLVKQQREAGRTGNAATYQNAINKLKKYTGQKDIAFKTIDYRFLKDWEADLLSKGKKVNSIGAYLRAIRAIYNQAIKSGIVEQKLYPFTKYKIKNEKTVQRTLSKKQITSIEQMEFDDYMMERAKDVFMLSFYFRGMNFRDMALLTEDNLQGDRIIYRREKTHKIYSVKIIPKAKELLDKYKSNRPMLLPIVSKKHCCNREVMIRSAREHLKNYNPRYYHIIGVKIGIPKMTTYYARYSWANIARKLGYSKDLIAEALGHEYGNKVTGIYLDNYDLEVIDEMNERVCV
mgnify:CR=1 FL=1